MTNLLDRADRTLGSCLVRLFALPFLAAGLWISFDMGRALWISFQLEAWETATGRVESVEDPFFGGLEVVVVFPARGAQHRTGRLTWGAHSRSQRDWEERLPVGGDVTVWFDPEDPSRAGLAPPDRAASSGVLALGIVCLGAGALLVRGRYRLSEMA